MVKIIAEVGVNHGGDTYRAERMMEWAHFSGADAVKFQMFQPDLLEPPGERREQLRKLQLHESAFKYLKERCDSKGIEFMCTPFDTESLEFLLSIGMASIKIASGNLNNIPLIEAALDSEKPLIISTGGATMAEIEECWEMVRECADLTFMHCVSAYPCPAEEVNLLAIPFLQTALDGKYKVGFSDHSMGAVAAIGAVAVSALVIEKHFTTEEGQGPDHGMSMMPADFGRMVWGIREIEKMLGTPGKTVQPHEVTEIFKEREAWRDRSDPG
jgi:N,N'-diacetyllegionaminate synthase